MYTLGCRSINLSVHVDSWARSAESNRLEALSSSILWLECSCLSPFVYERALEMLLRPIFLL